MAEGIIEARDSERFFAIYRYCEKGKYGKLSAIAAYIGKYGKFSS